MDNKAYRDSSDDFAMITTMLKVVRLRRVNDSSKKVHLGRWLKGVNSGRTTRRSLLPRRILRIIAILLSPVLPKAAHGIFDQLNWKRELSGKEERFRLEDAKWGGLPDGHVVGKPVPLFPRIETK